MELHDSQLATVWFDGDEAILIFSTAYIHWRKGMLLGRDHVTGWVRRAELVIGQVQGEPIELNRAWPFEVMEGSLCLGDVPLQNEIPIPLNFTGEVALTLSGYDDEGVWRSFDIRGKSADLTLLGSPRYVEEVSLKLEDGFRLLSVLDDGWTQDYEDPEDGSFWRLSYPKDQPLGFGTPTFVSLQSYEDVLPYGPFRDGRTSS